MEDILSSIKRIIAEEGDAGTPRQRRGVQGRPAPLPMSRDDEDEDEVLELSDPISPPTPPPAANGYDARPAAAAPRAPTGAQHAPTNHTPAHHTPAHQTSTEPHDAPAAHVSAATVEATRGALDSLSRLLVKPEPESDGTLEGLVREMLRPMVATWLDRNLPAIVEQLVAREIAKITAAQQ